MAGLDEMQHGARVVFNAGLDGDKEGTFLHWLATPSGRIAQVWYNQGKEQDWPAVRGVFETKIRGFQNITGYEPMQEVTNG